MERAKKMIPLTGSIIVREDHYEILRLIADGYTVPYIYHELADKYPGITIRTIGNFLNRFAIDKLKLSNHEWEPKKRTYNQSVRIANWFNAIFSENRSRMKYHGLKVISDYRNNGACVRTSTREITALTEIRSILSNLRRPTLRGPYNRRPIIEISAKDMNNKQKDLQPSVDFGEMAGQVVYFRYVFGHPIEKDDRVQFRTIGTFHDWYSRTQIEHAKLLAKKKESDTGYASRTTGDYISSWHQFNIRGKLDVECRFSENFPAQWPEVRVFSASWDRLHEIENSLTTVDAFKFNGKNHRKIGSKPVQSIRLITHGLPSCILMFLWKPYRK